jgi:hypothetical protein
MSDKDATQHPSEECLTRLALRHLIQELYTEKMTLSFASKGAMYLCDVSVEVGASSEVCFHMVSIAQYWQGIGHMAGIR